MLHELHNRRYNFAVIIQNFKTHKLLISCMSNRGLHPSRCMYHPTEIPQSQTAYNPVAPRGRVAQPSRDIQLVQFVLKTRVLRNIFVCVFSLNFKMGNQFKARNQSRVSALTCLPNATFTLCPWRPRQSQFRPPWAKRGDRNTT